MQNSIRCLLLLILAAAPTSFAVEGEPTVDLDVIGGNFSGCVFVDAEDAKFDHTRASFVNVTLTASPNIGFGISVTSKTRHLPLKLVATDLVGRLVENQRVSFNPPTLTLPESGQGAAQVRIDLKHPEDFSEMGPWGAEFLLEATLAGKEKVTRQPVIVRLPHGSPPDLLNMTAPASWVTSSSWQTVPENSLRAGREYYLHVFLPSISGSDVSISVEAPERYRFDPRQAELSIGGTPLSPRISCSQSCKIDLGAIDNENMYLVLPAVASADGGKESISGAETEFRIALDSENDGGRLGWNSLPLRHFRSKSLKGTTLFGTIANSTLKLRWSKDPAHREKSEG